MKRLYPLLLAALFLFLAACGQGETSPNDEAVYATVNGEPITNGEMEYFKALYRADVVNNHPDECTDPDFWEQTLNGMTPAAELEEMALNGATEAKLKLLMMQKKGIFDDISFAALKAKAEQYNEEHENMSGSVGILTIDLSSFYTYYVSTGEMELKNRLAEDELKPTEAEIEAVLSENPNLTEAGAVSQLVSESYAALIQEKINSAEITVTADSTQNEAE